MLKWIRWFFWGFQLSAIRLLRAREEILDLTAKLEVERHRIRKLEGPREIMGDDEWVGAMNIWVHEIDTKNYGWMIAVSVLIVIILKFSYPAAMYPYWVLLGTRDSWESYWDGKS